MEANVQVQVEGEREEKGKLIACVCLFGFTPLAML